MSRGRVSRVSGWCVSHASNAVGGFQDLMWKWVWACAWAFTLVVALSLSTVQAANLPDRIEDGVMLHCYDWPFSAIEANLDDIAAAGYRSIQVSPIQRIRVPTPGERTGDLPTGPWWLWLLGLAAIGNRGVARICLRQYHDGTNPGLQREGKVSLDARQVELFVARRRDEQRIDVRCDDLRLDFLP